MTARRSVNRSVCCPRSRSPPATAWPTETAVPATFSRARRNVPSTVDAELLGPPRQARERLLDGLDGLGDVDLAGRHAVVEPERLARHRHPEPDERADHEDEDREQREEGRDRRVRREPPREPVEQRGEQDGQDDGPEDGQEEALERPRERERDEDDEGDERPVLERADAHRHGGAGARGRGGRPEAPVLPGGRPGFRAGAPRVSPDPLPDLHKPLDAGPAVPYRSGTE